MKSLILGISLVLCLLFPLSSQEENKVSGPLYGKNYYLPHLQTYSFPGFSPQGGHEGEKSLSVAYYGINEFVGYDTENIALDYESSILEGSFTYRLEDNLMIGIDCRLISYYGGYMDTVIESWHSLFGFPNGGRENFDTNGLSVDLDNSGGRDGSLSDPVLSLGDTDLYALYTVKEATDYTLALAGAVKLPTGSYASLSGSDYLDLGVQFLGQWRFHKRWSVDLQQGFVFPGDVLLGVEEEDGYASKIQSQTFLALQFNPRSDWAIISQFRVNTSPISSEKERYYSYIGIYPFFTLPQIGLQVGAKKSFGDWVVQGYFEEDPFTYEGVDILIAFRGTHYF